MPEASNPFLRGYQSIDGGLARITLNDLTVMVEDEPFWQKFANGWEPDTEKTYRNVLGPGSTVVDIGAWIGSTLLFALACDVDHIIALEPNPGSYRKLSRMLELNPGIQSRISLHNLAIAEQPGPVTMGLAEGEDDTSTSGIRGQDFVVQAITLEQLLADHGVERPDLVKIDIEGAEVLIPNDLRALSRAVVQCVHLSIHVSFFPADADRQAFVDALKPYRIQDDRGQWLTREELSQRIFSSEKKPAWGTRHGNFFEVILQPAHGK